MRKKTLKIGIMSKEKYKERTIAIAKGEYKPKANEPKIWFESIKSMAQILSSENQELLRLIELEKPKSLKELEDLSGRAKPNLSRTLKTLQRYGIVELEKIKNTLVPEVIANTFELKMSV
jgi:predicted transcriptional regulator